MTDRHRQSRERLYRYLSVSLAAATALLLIPPEWIPIARAAEMPIEPEARPVKIVRLPPETLPPPPPLPPRPQPEPEPEYEPEPEPTAEIEELRPQLTEPEIQIPEQAEIVRTVELQTERVPDTIRAMDELPDLPQPVQPVERERKRVRVLAESSPTELRTEPQQVDVRVPKSVPRRAESRNIELAAASSTSYVDLEAPDAEIVTSRPSTRSSETPSLAPVSQQLKTGAMLRPTADAPDIDVPRGNTDAVSRSAPVAVGGAVTGTRVVYDKSPGSAADVAVPTNRAPRGSHEAPRVAAKGGVPGLDYSSAPADAAIGRASGRKPVQRGASRLESVRAALSRRYGLPLVAVNSLGQRSTDASRWNVLIPQISDLLRRARGLRSWRGGASDEVVSVEQDEGGIVIRYRDGIVHVLVPTEEGLAALFVARGPNARPVISKIEEAEQAKSALYRYTRGAS